MKLWLKYPRTMFICWRSRTAEQFWLKLAWLLPKRLVMFAFYRVFANATAGEYGSEDPHNVTAFDVIRRWPAQ